MTREEKIAKIYDVIARKDLMFGCLVKPLYSTKDEPIQPILGEDIEYTSKENFKIVLLSKKAGNHDEKTRLKSDIKIIGHPVMIGDVLDYCFNNGLGLKVQDIIDHGWVRYRDSVELQPDDAIDYIYNLIQ